MTVHNNNIMPYQVTWNMPEPRHEKALAALYKAYPQAQETIYITHENAQEFLR